jgi:rhomboid protease GluP
MDTGETDMVIVGRYLRRDQAEDRSLVLLALGVKNWIIPDDGLYALAVAFRNAERAAQELKIYEEERREEREEMLRRLQNAPPPVPIKRVSYTSLFIYVWLMVGFFHLQGIMPASYVEKGTANATLILQGEWWRTVTALTLHGDSGHLVANIGVGALFAWALLPLLGTGWTWFGFVASGALGNAMNAWGYRGESHLSIGASTAVFGALGMLVAWQVALLFQHRGASPTGPKRKGFSLFRFRELFIPIAAGLALLAYLGTGGGFEESRVDIMAHLFGMFGGVLVGTFLAWTQLPQRTSERGQKGLALLAVLIPVVAWWLALGGESHL